MSPSNQEYISSFKLEEDRLGRLCVRGIAKILLAHLHRSSPELFEIHKRDSGAVFSPQSDLELSFSHTRTHAAVAVGGSRCGIDIENNSRRLEREKIARRFFHADEYERVCQDPHSFFKIWTAKEAFLKHQGSGIDRPLREVIVGSDQKKVLFEEQSFPLFTMLEANPLGSSTLSIVGGKIYRKIDILDLL